MQETEPRIWSEKTAKTSFYHLQAWNNSLSLCSISSLAMRLLSLVYHAVEKKQQYKLRCLIHSKVFIITTIISPVAITTVNCTLALPSVWSFTLSSALWPALEIIVSIAVATVTLVQPSLPCPFSVLAPVISIIIVLVTTAFLIILTIFIPHPTTLTKGGLACRLAPSSFLKVFHKSNSHTVRLEESYLW